MVLRHSVNVLTSRFSLVYKVMLYLAIVILIFSAISVSAVYPIMRPVADDLNGMQFFKHMGDAFSSLFGGDLDAQSNAFLTLKLDWDRITDSVINNIYSIWWMVVVVIVLLLLLKFLVSLCLYSVTDISRHFMSSNSRFGFTSNMIANLKRSAAFAGVETLFSIPYYAIMVGVIWGLAELIMPLSGLLALMIIFSITVFLFALKRAIISAWLPGYVLEENGVFVSFKNAFKDAKSTWKYNLGLYFMFYLLATAVVVLVSLSTFGIGLVVSTALLIVLTRMIDLVIYYRKHDLRYYIDNDTVISPKHVVSDSF